MWRHNNDGLSNSFIGVFFSTFARLHLTPRFLLLRFSPMPFEKIAHTRTQERKKEKNYCFYFLLLSSFSFTDKNNDIYIKNERIAVCGVVSNPLYNIRSQKNTTLLEEASWCSHMLCSDQCSMCAPLASQSPPMHVIIIITIRFAGYRWTRHAPSWKWRSFSIDNKFPGESETVVQSVRHSEVRPHLPQRRSP